jgi:hypothetical protein
MNKTFNPKYSKTDLTINIKLSIVKENEELNMILIHAEKVDLYF